MIQPILCGGKSVATDLFISINSADSSYEVYIGLALLERVKIDPEQLQHKMLVGRLAKAGPQNRALEVSVLCSSPTMALEVVVWQGANS